MDGLRGVESHTVVDRGVNVHRVNRVGSRVGPDAVGRAGHHPGRIEAEDMQLSGYTPVEVKPSENASGGKAVECMGAESCTAEFRTNVAAGHYEINVQYFDQNNGDAKFRLYVGNKLLDEWTASDHLPSAKIGGDSSTRHRLTGVRLQAGDEIRIEGFADRGDRAALDYIEIQ